VTSVEPSALAAGRGCRAVIRAEPVGRLPKSPDLSARLADIYAGMDTVFEPLAASDSHDALMEFFEAAEQGIAENVQRQLEAGMDVVTDGEARRVRFINGFFDGVLGLAPRQHEPAAQHDCLATSELHVAARLERVRFPMGHDARYLHAITDVPFKVGCPAASLLWWPFHTFSRDAYPSRDALVEHALLLEREMIDEAIRQGCRHIQFDLPIYPMLVDPAWRWALEELGESAESLLTKAIAADRALQVGLPDDVTTSMHLCRGGFSGALSFQGTIAPIAERLLHELPVDRFLFELDDEDDFALLRHLPADRSATLGLVSVTNHALESEDEILRRIEQAGKHVDVDQLALAPQCGFGPSWEGSAEAVDRAWEKLGLVGSVSDRVWPR
jgi:5-methyltetrahydropteroyltriglutamate--homocysteine methyltransferase